MESPEEPKKEERGAGSGEDWSAEPTLPEGTVQLRAERFRMCAPWEIDFRIDFHRGANRVTDDGRTPLYTQTFALELLRDELESDAIKNGQTERRERKAAKVAAKSEKDAADWVKVEAAIRANPTNSPNTLGPKVGINARRLERLASDHRVTYSKDSKSWDGLAQVQK